MVPINYLAVVASVVLMMVLGWLWYGPVFGKQWVALMGFEPERIHDMELSHLKTMWKRYAIMAVGVLFMSVVLSFSVIFGSAYLHTGGIAAGLQAGFWNWLGFIVPISLGSVIWEGKSWKLWILNAGYYLVGLLLMGIVLSLWA